MNRSTRATDDADDADPEGLSHRVLTLVLKQLIAILPNGLHDSHVGKVELEQFGEAARDVKIEVLDIGDDFQFMNAGLVTLLQQRVRDVLGNVAT